MGKIALITGANGITGSAILTHLVQSTTADDWSQIIVTSRSPFATTIQDQRTKFIALDFLEDPNTVASKMKAGCSQVTHAYFSSYLHTDDFAKLNATNQALFENFLCALLQVAPELENITLQTGGKYYNAHLQPVPSPMLESSPRSTAPIPNFYFSQEDFLASKQKGQKWTWNVIRPEAIIGYTLKPNGMTSALTFALYFLVCKELGTEAVMPTNERYWGGVDSISDARLVADLTIFVSTHPKCVNEAFNVNNGDPFTWRYMWPRLAEYLGAKASSEYKFEKEFPKEGELQLEFSIAEWAKDKKEVWERICEKEGKGMKETWDAGTWQYLDWVFQRTWSATASISKARKYGWTGYIDSYESITDTFKKFREVGQIP